MKTHAKTNLLASLLQQSQRHARWNVPLPINTNTDPKVFTLSHALSRDKPRSGPFASTESNIAQTEIHREIILQIQSGGFIMEEHVCACSCMCSLWGGEESTSGCWSLIFSGMFVHRRGELSALPLPFATLSLSLCPKPNKHTWKMARDSLKVLPVHLYSVHCLWAQKHQDKHEDHSPAQRLAVLSAVMQNVVRENF